MKPALIALTAFVSCNWAMALAQEFNSIEYLCADWGPAMTLPTAEGETPQFSDTEEDIYFLKQIRVPSRVGIYLCKMKPDGSDKTEIKELWRNPNFPIDTQGQSTWMDVNERTRQIALSISYAGSDITGLWTMKLDGSELKRIVTDAPLEGEQKLRAINHPSWTPDGEWIVFEETLRGTRPIRSNIARCDANGGQFQRLVVAAETMRYDQPSVSPNGKQIAFIHWIIKGKAHDSWLWLMNVDGSESRPVPNPQAKPAWSAQAHWGRWPAWSPDGERILLGGVTATVVTLSTGKAKHLALGGHGTWGWPQWGKQGVVGHAVRGLLYTDADLKESKLLGPSRVVPCEAGQAEQCRW